MIEGGADAIIKYIPSTTKRGTAEMKIIVIGAGQGGLRAAALLAEKGIDISIYEKCSEEEIGFDWFDGITTKMFDDLGIAVPSDSFKGSPVSFIGPGSDKPLYIWCTPEGMDWSVNRKSFTAQLVAEARAKGAKIFFGKTVESLIFAGSSVSGIVADGESIYSDLVIDSSGMYSPFRQAVSSRARITAMSDEEDVFNVYREICEQVPDFPELPANRKFQMFLKYQGKSSISWCGVEPSGELNVLVGMIGKMTDEDFDMLYSHLREDNPIIGGIKNGRCAKTAIPVRYPLTRFSFHGYTAIGDAAFMTIPIMGSGIENSIRAGQMLAETVIENNSVSIETLWKYQVKYYRSAGAVCFLLDWAKRGLLATDNAELKKFMESGAVRDEDIKAVMSGNIGEIPLGEWLAKPAKFLASHSFVGGLMKYIVKGLRAAAVAYSIPSEYDTLKVNQWVYRAENAMKR